MHPCNLVPQHVDDANPSEELQVHQEEFIIPGIADTLQFLVMDNFRGGTVEICFARHILALARELTSLPVYPHSGMLYEAVVQAITPLKMCPKASPHVSVAFASNG